MELISGEVYHVRLNSGEDLISQVEFSKESGMLGYISLTNPMKILCIPSRKQGFVSLSLMQWIFAKISSDQKFDIYNKDILTISNPNETLKEYYHETVLYFNTKELGNFETEDDYSEQEYLEQIEKEIAAVNTSDKLVDNENVRSAVEVFLNSLSSNSKGTLH